ncbi:MAG: type II toxin-antitoxin system VapC family toxin [Sedimentisphaerales bacterium]|jgi:tRNA(fMet)-specific endonuclease VapC|nr:type II toxin-antitoxin system VapC family toxin [Planctomycetota bacterium]MDY0357533.1 type II toxin-antitoxin system VapC family toxin [Sedimentisphaerales bacterium]
MACLDTTILIDLLSRRSARKRQAVRKIEELAEKGQALTTTRFNVAELYVGLARSTRPEEDEQAIDTLLREFEVLEFNDAAARVFGSITGFLQQIGKPAGDMDVLIASTAMVHGHSLITRNARHFRHIPHLIVEDY